MNTLVVTNNPNRRHEAEGHYEVAPGGNVCGFADLDVIEVQHELPPDMPRFVAWFKHAVLGRASPDAQFRLPSWLVWELQR